MWYDRQNGYVVVERTGLLSLQDARAFLDQSLQLVATMRRERGYARVLVLNRDNVVQSREVTDLFANTPSQIQGPDDRVALVANTALTKLQADRLARGGPERVFMSEEEAVAWLREPIVQHAAKS
ncbi:hypothetical protein [Sphingobium sp. Sx8-8]|uniref:hypothetical protein n=1 Tax=Sphingobium sp. Sx8-8 TaxID=2933617 RepID=UPI001F5A4E27|nr:hypothetical protein [Sphingobium sp. Sx8-8]